MYTFKHSTDQNEVHRLGLVWGDRAAPLQVPEASMSLSDEEILVPIDEDEFLDFPSVPSEEPSISKNSSCATSSSFQDLKSGSSIIPFEMYEDSDTELMFDSEEESSDESLCYDRMASHSSSTQSMRESLLEFSRQTGEEEDHLLRSTVVESPVLREGGLVNSITQSSQEQKEQEFISPDPVVHYPAPSQGDSKDEPALPSAPETDLERQEEIEYPAVSVRSKMWMMMKKSANMLRKEADELRLLANQSLFDLDRTLSDLDTKFGVSRKVGDINYRCGISARLEEITKDINTASTPICKATDEVILAMAKVTEVLRENLRKSVDAVLNDGEEVDLPRFE